MQNTQPYTCVLRPIAVTWTRLPLCGEYSRSSYFSLKTRVDVQLRLSQTNARALQQTSAFVLTAALFLHLSLLNARQMPQTSRASGFWIVCSRKRSLMSTANGKKALGRARWRSLWLNVNTDSIYCTMQGSKTGETINQTYHRQYLHHPDGRIVWAHPTGAG